MKFGQSFHIMLGHFNSFELTNNDIARLLVWLQAMKPIAVNTQVHLIQDSIHIHIYVCKSLKVHYCA